MFTTGLEPNALAVTGIAGLHPLGQVMGACVYHSKFIRGDVKLTGRPGVVYQYPTVVESVRATRLQALQRLARDARNLGADAVVGVRVSHEEQHWGTAESNDGTVEAVATGMAVAWRDRPLPGRGPVLTNLGIQGCWKLAQGGYAPVGLVMSTVMTACTTRRWPPNAPVVDTPGQLKWENYEYEEVSEMVSTAYQDIDENIREQGRAMGAEGIIGVEVDSRKWREEEEPRHFKMIVTVIGTAVVAISDGDGRPAGRRPGLRITPVRHAGLRGLSAARARSGHFTHPQSPNS